MKEEVQRGDEDEDDKTRSENKEQLRKMVHISGTVKEKKSRMRGE